MLNASSHTAIFQESVLQELGPSSWYYDNKVNGYNAPPDIYINPYWKQFNAPAPYLHYILGSLYAVLIVISIIGNGIVLYIFAVSKKLRTPANVFVIGLAIADLIMLSKMPLFVYNSFKLGPAFGSIGCDVYGTIGAYSGFASAFCNATIAYDRYRVIVHPFSKSGMTMTKAIFYLVLIYIYISPLALLPVFHVWSRYAPEGFLTSCTADFFKHDLNGQSYIICAWLLGWFIPICIVMYCYFLIFLAVRSHEKQIKKQARKMNVDSFRSNSPVNNSSAEMRIAKTAFCVLLLFLFSWVPYITVAFTAGFSDPKLRRITPVLSMIPALATKASACFDPFLYAISHPKYRQELQKKMPWLCIHENLDEQNVSSDESVKTTV